MIVTRPGHFGREIVLTGGIGIGFVMSVTVLCTQPHFLHQLGWRIAQMFGHIIIRPLFSIAHRRFEGDINGITFWRAGQVNDRLSNRTFTFGRTNAGKAVPGGYRHLHTARIGIADIFRSNGQQPARHIQRIASGGNNARIPVQRSIRGGTSHRFMQRRNKIVKTIAFIVEARAAFAGDFFQ